jgi:hypothetical protein
MLAASPLGALENCSVGNDAIKLFETGVADIAQPWLALQPYSD